MKLKIYVAGSFKNADRIRVIGEALRLSGYDVYVFCDEDEPTYRLGQELRQQVDVATLTPLSIYENKILKTIGALNYTNLLRCDALVLVLPSGRSAHLEAGWMCGQHRPVYVIGPMVPGEFDAMYMMVNGIFTEEQYPQLAQQMKTDLEKKQQK